MTSAVILDAVRTPVAKGKPGGGYSNVHPVVLGAGFPETVSAVTVDRQCGSSQQALHGSSPRGSAQS